MTVCTSYSVQLHLCTYVRPFVCDLILMRLGRLTCLLACLPTLDSTRLRDAFNFPEKGTNFEIRRVRKYRGKNIFPWDSLPASRQWTQPTTIRIYYFHPSFALSVYFGRLIGAQTLQMSIIDGSSFYLCSVVWTQISYAYVRTVSIFVGLLWIGHMLRTVI